MKAIDEFIEKVKESIENALYSTGAFTVEECSDVADIIMVYLKDNKSDLTALIDDACREKDEEIEKLTILLDAAKSSIILLRDLYGW